MPTTNLRILFAPGLCAALAAQGSVESMAPNSEAAPAAGQPSLLRSSASRPQDNDYSLHSLFQQDHGDFMLKRQRFDPSVEVSAGALFSGAISSEPGDFDLWRTGFDAELRSAVSPDAFLSYGAFYGGRHYETNSMPGFGNEALYQGGLHVGIGAFVATDVLVELKARPGSWSDWDGTLHTEDFDCPTSLLATARYSEEFFFKVGARYNEIYEDANVLPYLGLAWASESVRVDVLLPEYAEVSLWPSPDFAFLLGVEVTGAEYNVRSSIATGKQRQEIRVQEAVVYVGMQWLLDDTFSFEVRSGSAVAGDYKVGDGTGALVSGQLEPSFFVDVSLGFDF